MRKRRIFDCFVFFNELDLLEVRLRTLAPVVDYFVLGESPVTFRAEPKPLYFAENQARFGEFGERIRHVVIEDLPMTKGLDANWNRETLQRDALKRGLFDAGDDDVVMMSDLDELPCPEKVAEAAGFRGELRIFRMRFFSYFANYEPHPGKDWWNGTAMAEFGKVKHHFEYLLRKVPTRLSLRPWDKFWKRLSRDVRAFVLGRMRGLPIRFIEQGGWHFSSLGGAEAVLKKRAAASIHHGQVFPADYYTLQGAAAAVEKAVRNARQPDAGLPAALRDERFAHFFADVQKRGA